MSTGLHPLTPYFTKFIADEIGAGLKKLHTLHMMLSMTSTLLSNPHIRLEHYVHQLLPPVLTCLVAKGIGEQDGLIHSSNGKASDATPPCVQGLVHSLVS